MLFNPLKIFLPASIFISLVGLAYGIWGYAMVSRFPNSATILITMGMFLFFIGLIADQVSTLNRK
jgi:hypothetical protein